MSNSTMCWLLMTTSLLAGDWECNNCVKPAGWWSQGNKYSLHIQYICTHKYIYTHTFKHIVYLHVLLVLKKTNNATHLSMKWYNSYFILFYHFDTISSVFFSYKKLSGLKSIFPKKKPMHLNDSVIIVFERTRTNCQKGTHNRCRNARVIFSIYWQSQKRICTIKEERCLSRSA